MLRLLFDRNLSPLEIRAAREAGFDALDARDFGEDPGDAAILELARRLGAAIVTQDKDFGYLVMTSPGRTAGVLRFARMNVRQRCAALPAVLRAHGEQLMAGCLITVDAERVRVTQLPH